MSNPLLSALQDAFDDGDGLPEGNTIKEVVKMVEMWLDGQAPAERITRALENMAGTAAQAAFATERDIEEAGEMAPDLREPTERSLLAYRSMVGTLESLCEAVHQQASGRAQADLEELKASAGELAAAQQAFQAWMQSAAPTCPRCGATEVSACAQPDFCPKEFFIPDIHAATGMAQQTATLGPDYVRAYEAFSQVVSGEAGLAVLLQALTPLERYLEEALAGAQAAFNEEEDNVHLEALHDAVLDSLDGVDQIRRAATSRRMSDLNQGWKKIFEGAIRLLQHTASLAEEAGETPTSTISTEDSVFISGDE